MCTRCGCRPSLPLRRWEKNATTDRAAVDTRTFLLVAIFDGPPKRRRDARCCVVGGGSRTAAGAWSRTRPTTNRDKVHRTRMSAFEACGARAAGLSSKHVFWTPRVVHLRLHSSAADRRGESTCTSTRVPVHFHCCVLWHGGGRGKNNRDEDNTNNEGAQQRVLVCVRCSFRVQLPCARGATSEWTLKCNRAMAPNSYRIALCRVMATLVNISQFWRDTLYLQIIASFTHQNQNSTTQPHGAIKR